MISPTRCPICGKNTVYVGRCSECWWEEPKLLEARAEAYKHFRECWDVEKKQFKAECIHLTNEKKGGHHDTS